MKVAAGGWPCAILIAWVIIGVGQATEPVTRSTDAGADAGTSRADGGATTKPGASDDSEVAANLDLLQDLPTVEALDLIQNLAPAP